MQIATFFRQYTGLTLDQLYNGKSGPLLSPRMDADGVVRFDFWKVEGKEPPTSDEMIAALQAPEPKSI